MKKIALILVIIFALASIAEAGVKYEYKIVPLGALTSLQKSKEASKKTAEVEGILNAQGSEGWEIAEIFAVRTTFEPNVFFAVMKRKLDE